MRPSADSKTMRQILASRAYKSYIQTAGNRSNHRTFYSGYAFADYQRYNWLRWALREK